MAAEANSVLEFRPGLNSTLLIAAATRGRHTFFCVILALCLESPELRKTSSRACGCQSCHGWPIARGWTYCSHSF